MFVYIKWVFGVKKNTIFVIILLNIVNIDMNITVM